MMNLNTRNTDATSLQYEYTSGTESVDTNVLLL